MRRSKHSLSNYKLGSCDLGELIPIGLTEVLPGDSIQQATNALIRAAPLLSPVMHPVVCSITHWYVPHRLVWEDFEKFITGGPDGMDASVFPTITMPGSGGAVVGSLADYLGIPTAVNSLEVSALPFRAYAMVFNEWFRDQDLVTPLVIDITSGADTTTNTTLQNGAWEKDYFTSARPWEQKGPAITIPLGTNAPVKGIGIHNARVAATSATTWVEATGTTWTGVGTWEGLHNTDILGVRGVSNNAPNTTTNKPQIFADLTGVSSVTVNVLREALALQRYEEARARYGSRYTEYLQYLGVRSSDARLQRPEYCGGGKETIQFSEVLQTAEGAEPVGTLRGHGISSMRSNRFRRFLRSMVISLRSSPLDQKPCMPTDCPDTGIEELKKTSGKKSLNISASKKF